MPYSRCRVFCRHANVIIVEGIRKPSCARLSADCRHPGNAPATTVIEDMRRGSYSLARNVRFAALNSLRRPRITQRF